jgi:hypothetical protein
MNNVLFSLLMAAMGQFGGPGAGLLLPGPGLPGGLAPAPYPLPPGGSRSDLPVTTLAVVECLGREGRIDGRQARELLDLQGRRRGWPRTWPAAFSRRRVAAVIRGAGGCRPLLARVSGGGGRFGAPVPAPHSGRAPLRSPRPSGPPSSEQERFGLAPYL